MKAGNTKMRELEVVPMPVGAEVTGLRFETPIPDPVKQALYAAWLEFGILVFRNVDSADRHIELSRCFGELEIHPFPEARAAEDPLFIEIGGAKQAPALMYDETDLRVNRIPWHRDTAYTPGICKGAILRMLETPPVEGETLFADTAMAYDDLPEDMKARLERLEYKATLRLGNLDQTRPGALWKTAREPTPQEDPHHAPQRIYGAEAVARYPSVIHPAVLTHPESGRKCIFLSPTYVDAFLGMTQAQSDALLVRLVEHQTQPRYVYKHHWAPNDAILWDNRRFMHAAVGNRPGDRRRGLRTTLAGQLYTGRYYEETSTPPAGPALVD
jgi:taurine dioxygenase